MESVCKNIIGVDKSQEDASRPKEIASSEQYMSGDSELSVEISLRTRFKIRPMAEECRSGNKAFG